MNISEESDLIVYTAGAGITIEGNVIRANIGSTSSQVAAGNHTHANYAAANHTHDYSNTYALKSHTHSDYVTSDAFEAAIEATAEVNHEHTVSDITDFPDISSSASSISSNSDYLVTGGAVYAKYGSPSTSSSSIASGNTSLVTGGAIYSKYGDISNSASSISSGSTSLVTGGAIHSKYGNGNSGREVTITNSGGYRQAVLSTSSAYTLNFLAGSGVELYTGNENNISNNVDIKITSSGLVVSGSASTGYVVAYNGNNATWTSLSSLIGSGYPSTGDVVTYNGTNMVWQAPSVQVENDQFICYSGNDPIYSKRLEFRQYYKNGNSYDWEDVRILTEDDLVVENDTNNYLGDVDGEYLYTRIVTIRQNRIKYNNYSSSYYNDPEDIRLLTEDDLTNLVKVREDYYHSIGYVDNTTIYPVIATITQNRVNYDSDYDEYYTDTEEVRLLTEDDIRVIDDFDKALGTVNRDTVYAKKVVIKQNKVVEDTINEETVYFNEPEDVALLTEETGAPAVYKHITIASNTAESVVIMPSEYYMAGTLYLFDKTEDTATIIDVLVVYGRLRTQVRLSSDDSGNDLPSNYYVVRLSSGSLYLDVPAQSSGANLYIRFVYTI